MKIAIETDGFDGWAGGIDLIGHISNCIGSMNDEGRYQIDILITKNDIFSRLKFFFRSLKSNLKSMVISNNFKTIAFNKFNQSYLEDHFFGIPNTSIKLVSSLKFLRRSFIKKNHYDILFPCFLPMPCNFPIPWIGYLYDFQHVYYSDLFSSIEINRRKKHFEKMLRQAKNIIVNSEAVKNDATNYIEDNAAKIHSLPFSPSPRKEWLDDSRDLSNKYKISNRYFIICNQFWRHKDHLTAFQAFINYLEKSDTNHELVCTGNMIDNRFPDYLDELMDLVDSSIYKKNFKMLGHIPKLDQISLLKRSIAVIQPTLFEGGPGGGASYDAISLGKPLIISDIPINKEIETNDRILFFKKGDSEDLAKKLLAIASYNFNNLDKNELEILGEKRKKKCGYFITELISEIIKD